MVDMFDPLHVVKLAMMEVMENSKDKSPEEIQLQLLERAVRVAKMVPSVNYKDLNEWELAVRERRNPLYKIEGESIRIHGNIFYLPKCPFAHFKNTFPREVVLKLLEEFNKSSKITEELKVGAGSGVGPFCPIHQPLRAIVGRKIKVGNKNVMIYQLGCKSAVTGKKNISKRLVDEFGIDEDTIDKLLDRGMCVYGVKLEE